MDEKVNQPEIKKDIFQSERQLENSNIQKSVDKTTKKMLNPNNSVIKKFVSNHREYISNFIILADTKAAFLIGIGSGFLITLYNNYHIFFLKNIKLWNLLDIISFLSLLFLLFAIIFAIFVVFPRLITNKKKGLVSWVDISNYESSNEYVTDLLKQSEENLIKEYFSVNYFLSLVCKKKYYWLSFSFITLIIGILLGILVFINI